METLLVGSAGTMQTLDLARKYNARYLHASTSECYGDPEVHPQVETYWGKRQSHRSALGIRRGETFFGGRGDGLPPLLRRRHEARPHLQYLRPAVAGQ